MADGPLGCVALAASTGGLPALFEFLRRSRRSSACRSCHQHLPPVFMSHFARQ